MQSRAEPWHLPECSASAPEPAEKPLLTAPGHQCPWGVISMQYLSRCAQPRTDLLHLSEAPAPHPAGLPRCNSWLRMGPGACRVYREERDGEAFPRPLVIALAASYTHWETLGLFLIRKGLCYGKLQAGTALLGPKGRNGDGNRVNAFWFSNLVGKLPCGVKAEATQGLAKPWERSCFQGFAAKPLGGSRASKRRGQRASPGRQGRQLRSEAPDRKQLPAGAGRAAPRFAAVWLILLLLAMPFPLFLSCLI